MGVKCAMLIEPSRSISHTVHCHSFKVVRLWQWVRPELLSVESRNARFLLKITELIASKSSSYFTPFVMTKSYRTIWKTMVNLSKIKQWTLPWNQSTNHTKWEWMGHIEMWFSPLNTTICRSIYPEKTAGRLYECYYLDLFAIYSLVHNPLPLCCHIIYYDHTCQGSTPDI